VVETDADKDDQDGEEETEVDREAYYMAYISRKRVDGYLVSIIGHLEK
jgi:hypothetical protein